MSEGGGKVGGRDYRERLIDEVKRCPVLYNTRHEHHRDIDVRDRCWTDIANKLNANSEVLKREWKILRDSLRQSLRKSSGAGAGVTKAGMPSKRWRFQSRMAFLVPYMTKRGQRTAAREDLKLDETEETDGAEQPGEGGAGEWREAGAGAGGDVDALELFFAAVCAGARRLPPHEQRRLRQQVLDALSQAEQRAEGPPPPAAPAAAPAAAGVKPAPADNNHHDF